MSTTNHDILEATGTTAVTCDDTNVDMLLRSIPLPEGVTSVRLNCPNCEGGSDGTLAVYADGTHCFRCGFRELPAEFISRAEQEGISLDAASRRRNLRSSNTVRAGADFERDCRVLIETWNRTLTEGPRQNRLEYLYERGLYHSTIVKHRIGHTGERFVIPLRQVGVSDNGRRVHDQLVGWKLRSDPRYCDPDTVKYLQFSDPKTVMFRPSPRDGPVVFCEGEFDALILAQAGCDSITSTGGAGSLEKTCGHLGFKRVVYIATDQDDAGEDAARRLSIAYPTALRLRWSDGNDVSEAIARSEESPLRTIRRWIETAERM